MWALAKESSKEREFDRSIAEAELVLTLDPGGAWAHYWYASALTQACRPEEAIPLFQKAIRLNPFDPNLFYTGFGNALFMTGRYEEAASAYKKVLQRAPNHLFGHLWLAATYSMMDREKEARAEAAEVLRINPKFSMDYVAKTSLYKEQSVTENMLNALRKAGLK